MKYIGLIIGIVLGFIGIYKIDVVLIKGLNYFGKYVFFVIFHLFILYIYYFIYKKSEGRLKIILPIIFGMILLLFGIILG